jgi:hypothetical protein
MKVAVHVADSAQTDSHGKVHALGLGWSITSTPTSAQAVIVLIELEPNELGSHRLSIKLFDQGGKPVIVQDAVGGGQELGFAGEFTAEVSADAPEGWPGRVAIAVNVAPGIPLLPGQRYEWRVAVDEKHDPSWVAEFLTRKASAAPD